MSSAQPAQSNTKTNAPIDEDLPPQLHAGKVGYGPNYRSGPTLEEKVVGLKEELLGKATHDRDRVQHGHEVRTGEEKRKKLTGEDEPNPFAAAEEDHSKSPAAGLKDDKPHDQSCTNPSKSPTSSSQHNTTSTPGHKSTTSAAHRQNTNAQTTSSLKNGSTPSDFNQTSGKDKQRGLTVNDPAASDVNQSVPTPGINKHTGSTVNNTTASDVDQRVPTPSANKHTSSTVNNTAASDVNRSVPASTTNNNIPKFTNNSNMPSTATNKNPLSTTNTATSNNTSRHLGSNEHHSSPVTGHNDHAHGQPVPSDNDALSRYSYKPSPEQLTLDLDDKKEKERAATIAPMGTQAAEGHRTGGNNVTENKHIN